LKFVKALIVIDVQQGLFQADPAPAFAAEVIERINTLTARARAENVPVIFVQYELASGEFLVRGSESWKVDHRLATADTDHYISKTTPDSFLRTDLQPLLQQANISHLVVCGYATEFCVDTTIRRGAGLGYEITLVSDAHTTQSKAHADAAQIIAHHTATLPSIKSFGVPIQAQETTAVDFIA
jgi:nicotinamidase-related amidase